MKGLDKVLTQHGVELVQKKIRELNPHNLMLKMEILKNGRSLRSFVIKYKKDDQTFYRTYYSNSVIWMVKNESFTSIQLSDYTE